MTVKIFGQPQQVIDLIATANPIVLDQDLDIPELSTEALIEALELVAVDIINGFETNFGKDGSVYTLPSVMPDPITQEWALLELLNIEEVLADIHIALTGLVEPQLRRQSRTAKMIAVERRERLRRGEFNATWDNKPLPINPLAVALDCCRQVSNLKPLPTSKPPDTVMDRLILRYSAVMHALGANHGYDTSTEGIAGNDTAIKLLKKLVIYPVSSTLVRINTIQPQFPALDQKANKLLSEGAELEDEFALNGYETNFS